MPACLAVIEQIPAAIRDTSFPEIEQFCGVFEERLTGNPELAVATKVIGATPYVIGVAGALKVIVCVDGTITETEADLMTFCSVTLMRTPYDPPAAVEATLTVMTADPEDAPPVLILALTPDEGGPFAVNRTELSNGLVLVAQVTVDVPLLP